MLQTLHLCMFLLRGPPYSCAFHMGVCLICLAWTALWLRSPYGRVLHMFGMDRPIVVVSLRACAEYVWHGPPYGRGCLPVRVLIYLAWAALWQRQP